MDSKRAKPNVREKVVEAALALFHAKGFNATGVQDIVEAAGVPKGSFYNHFASKEALAVTVLARYLDAIASPVLEDTTLAPTDRVREHFQHMAEIAERNGFSRGCLVGNFSTELASQSAEIKSRLEITFEAWSERLARVIQETQSSRNQNAASSRAYSLIYAWEGALMHAKVTGDRSPVERFFGEILPNLA